LWERLPAAINVPLLQTKKLHNSRMRQRKRSTAKQFVLLCFILIKLPSVLLFNVYVSDMNLLDLRELPNLNIPNLLAFLVVFFVALTVT
jgi:hypothetical protein